MRNADDAFCSTRITVSLCVEHRVLDRVHELGRHERREAQRGLVEQEHRRLGDERPGHGEHLALAARELGRVLAATLAEHREQLVLLRERAA